MARLPRAFQADTEFLERQGLDMSISAAAPKESSARLSLQFPCRLCQDAQTLLARPSKLPLSALLRVGLSARVWDQLTRRARRLPCSIFRLVLAHRHAVCLARIGSLNAAPCASLKTSFGPCAWWRPCWTLGAILAFACVTRTASKRFQQVSGAVSGV